MESKDEIGMAHSEMDKAGEKGEVCDICGNYTEDLKEVNGQMVCEECRETSPEA